MNNNDYTKYFVETTDLLLKQLKSWLPDDQSITSAISRFETAKTVLGPKLIIAKFMEHVLPCRDLLWKKDPEFFDIVHEFGDVSMFHHLSADNQLFVWKKIEAMVILASKVLNIPHESLFTSQ